jgi:fatty acid desaturase
MLDSNSCIALGRDGTRRGEHRLEMPTIGIALAIYAGFFTLTWFFDRLPLVLAAPLGALVLAWYGSLQHETIHGHPTSSRRINSVLASPPLALWLPYPVYREIHLLHHRHRGRYLTVPIMDTESYYRQPGTLSRVGRFRRALYRANCTLLGRLLLGPALAIHGVWAAQLSKLKSAPRRTMQVLLGHLLGVSVVLAWIVGVCRVPLIVYVSLVVYPAISLVKLRSFIEHRAADDPDCRTVVVEAAPFWGLLFLNNNLHIAHHARPTLPWYRLPRAWREMRASVIESCGSEAKLVWQGGYLELFRTYLLRPALSVEHPLKDTPGP